MLLIVVLVLLLMWGGGFALNVGSGLIHTLLIVALVVAVIHFFTPYGGRNRTSL